MGEVAQPAVGAVSDYAGQRVTIHGKIAGIPIVSPSTAGEWKVRYAVELDNIITGGDDKLPRRITGGVMLSSRRNSPRQVGSDGDSITAEGSVHLFHAYHNPGQADWSETLAIRGIDARISAIPGAVRIESKEGNDTFITRLARWRNQVKAAMMEAMPDTDAALIMGMLFGGYEGIERETVRDFAATGIVHILSVSGAHIALLAAAVFWLARRLSVPEAYSAAVAGATMIVYGFISGFSAPVIRSVIMGLITMLGLCMGRISSASQALSVGALGMLIWEPRNLFDISFQLSVGCTAGLLYISPTISSYLQEILPDRVADGIGATLAAQIAVIPFLAWYFGTFPLMSLAANIVVVPILEAVILFGLLAVLLTGGFSAAAHPLFVAVSLLAGTAVEINRLLSKIPGWLLCLPAMGLGWSALYYLLLGWLLGQTGSRIPSLRELFRRWPIKSAAGAITILVIIGWGILRPGPLMVHFIDVGQGDSTLIVTPHGRSILVDTGGTLGPGNDFDIGERVVVPYLRHYGVGAVDWLILTHNHQDHAGGAAAVAQILGVKQALLRTGGTEPAILRFQQVMQEKGLKNADTIDEIRIDGVKVQLFHVGDINDEESAKRNDRRSSSENARSTVVRIEYGQHSFMLTGDLEGESEKRIVENGVPISTVLKVGHHGSKLSSRPELLTRLAPHYAVISVGADNRFGHPAPETLQRLQEWPIRVYRTDRDGAVVFCSDGENLTVEKTVH